jgi:hypothetical protein
MYGASTFSSDQDGELCRACIEFESEPQLNADSELAAVRPNRMGH